MKKVHLIITSVITILAVANVKTALALTIPKIEISRTPTLIVTPSTTPTTIPTTIQIKPRPSIEFKTVLKKTNVLKEIERRLASFNKLKEKLTNVEKITLAQKQVLEAQIKIEIGKLEELKAQIEEETDITALQEQKKSIQNSYKSYALYLPKIEIIAHADKIIEIANSMSSKTTNPDLLTKISDARTKAEVAISIVMPLLPEQYPDYKVDFKEARDTLRESRLLLNSVFGELKTEQ